ncbi:MAG: DedA family protein, partial [Nocardioides sp.]
MIGAAVLAASTSGDPADLDGVAGWAVDLMERLGPLGAGIAIALENLFPPLPSEIILPLAGFTASRGTFSLAEAIVWTTAGSVVGAIVLYWLGV